MNQKEKLKIEIQEIINKKEDLKFGYDKISNYFLTTLVFLGTLSITLSISISNIKWILLGSISFIILIIFSFLFIFNPMLKLRYCLIEGLINKMEEKYNKLKSLK